MKHEAMQNFQRNVEPVDPRYVKDIESKLQKDAREYETQNPEVVSWIRESLSRVDHTKLNTVFQRIASRGGTLNHAGEIVPPERTFVDARKDIGGHSYIGHINAFSGDEFKALLQMHTPREAGTVLFDALCHENAHATGFVDIKIARRGNVDISGGYEEIVKTGEKINRYQLFNEGVAEIIGELAAGMYLEESPLELADKSFLTIDEYDTYVREELMKGTGLSIGQRSLDAREFVCRLAEHVAKALGTPPEDVVGRLIAGFFRGGGLSAQLGLSLAETVGPDFVAELAGATTGDDLESLAKKYHFGELTPHIHQRTMDYLRSDSLVHAA